MQDRDNNPFDDTQRGLFQAPLSGVTGLGVSFNRRMQEEFIQERGQQVVHSMAISCPHCRKSYRHDFFSGPIVMSSCDVCDGKGFLYRDSRRMMGVVTGLKSNRQWREIGMMNPGDFMMSVSPSLNPPVSDYDLITLTIPLPLDDGQVIIRGRDFEDEKELLKRDQTRLLKDNEDRLLYRAANALWVEDDNGKVYHQDTDFVFEGKVIRWLNVPKVRTRITVKYRCYFDCIAWSSPFERYDRGESLGQQVLLRKVHIAFTKEDPHEPDGVTGKARLQGIMSTKV